MASDFCVLWNLRAACARRTIPVELGADLMLVVVFEEVLNLTRRNLCEYAWESSCQHMYLI